MERPHYDLTASGERMRNIRKQRNITVKEVQCYMEFESSQAVYKWESGKCFPQADNLIALAKLYQVNPMDLLVEEGHSPLFLLYEEWRPEKADYNLYRQLTS